MELTVCLFTNTLRKLTLLFTGNVKMCERYECTLSPELLKKAVEELNEPEENDKRLAAIDKLRTRFQEEDNGLELIRSDDAFLLRFLRVRKFDQDRAVATLVNYHKQRQEWRELFNLVANPRKFEYLATAGAAAPLQNTRTKTGEFVIVGRPGYGFKKSDDMLKFVALLILTLEKLLEQEEFQIRGLLVIQNLYHTGFSLATQMPSIGRRMFSLLQDAMPIRVKSLNIVNEPVVFDMIYVIINKFLKEKMKKRLQLHGRNYEKLHQKIDPTCLPPFLGGTGPDLDGEWWSKEIITNGDEV